MKITRTLSIISVILCCIYILADFMLAFFPKDVCILFGMKIALSIKPEYILHNIAPPLPYEAYTIDPVYSVGHIGAIAVFLIPTVISAILLLLKKTKKLPIILSWFSLFTFGITGALIDAAVQFTLSSRNFSEADFYVISCIHSFIMLFGFCGAAFCVIAAMYSRSRLGVHSLSIISIILSAVYLIWKIVTLILTGNINDYDIYYSASAVILIILSTLSYFGKANKCTAVFSLILAAFPLILQLWLSLASGDYYGFMSLLGQTDSVSYIWLTGSILCAVSSLKGVYNENPESD